MTTTSEVKTVAPIFGDPHKIGRLGQILENISYTSNGLRKNLFDFMAIPDWVDDEEEFLEDLIEYANSDLNRIIDNVNKIKEILPDGD